MQQETVTTYEIDRTKTIFQITVQQVTMDDGSIVRGDPHRVPFIPMMAVESLPAEVAAVAATLWSPEVIAAYQASMDAAA